LDTVKYIKTDLWADTLFKTSKQMKNYPKISLAFFCFLLQCISSCEYDPDNPGVCISYSAVIYNTECGCDENTDRECIRTISITENQYNCLQEVLNSTPGSCYLFESISCLPGEEGGYLASVHSYQDFIQEVFCTN
jgi:hypothetical protein